MAYTSAAATDVDSPHVYSFEKKANNGIIPENKTCTYKRTIMAVLTLHRYTGKHIAGRSSLFHPVHDRNRGLFDTAVPLRPTWVNREQPTSSHLPAYLPTYCPTHTSVKHKHIYFFHLH